VASLMGFLLKPFPKLNFSRWLLYCLARQT
jgi:hypothetical protein